MLQPYAFGLQLGCVIYTSVNPLQLATKIQRLEMGPRIFLMLFQTMNESKLLFKLQFPFKIYSTTQKRHLGNDRVKICRDLFALLTHTLETWISDKDICFSYFVSVPDKQKIENETKKQTQRDSTIEVLEENLNLWSAKVSVPSVDFSHSFLFVFNFNCFVSFVFLLLFFLLFVDWMLNCVPGTKCRIDSHWNGEEAARDAEWHWNAIQVRKQNTK